MLNGSLEKLTSALKRSLERSTKRHEYNSCPSLFRGIVDILANCLCGVGRRTVKLFAVFPGEQGVRRSMFIYSDSFCSPWMFR